MPGKMQSWGRTGKTLGLGIVGGSVFFYLNLPLAWMLGAMLATTAASLGGADLRLPHKLRGAFITILGVYLGSAFNANILEQITRWPLTPSALVLYVGAITAMLYVYFRKVLKFDTVSAFFSATPGGLGTMVITGGALGGLAEMSMIALSLGIETAFVAIHHMFRIMLIVVTAPLVFNLLRRYTNQPAPLDPSL